MRESYPDQATLTADQVALSEYVYATDTIAGVTNNSAEASPKPIANWIMPHRTVVGDTVELEVAAFHRDARAGKQVVCVIFSATDGTTTVTATVAAPAVSGRAGDQYPVISYKAALDISTLADDALITCNAKVYPWTGDASSVADSADSSVAREFSPRYFLRNTTLAAAPPIAYVSTSGNDGTGVVSTDKATAAATPFLTWAGAYGGLRAQLSRMDGGVIMIGDDGGTPFPMVLAFNTYIQNIGSVTVTRDPAVARANARVSFGASGARFRLGSTGTITSPDGEGAIHFRDIAVVRTGAGGNLQGEAAYPLQVVMDDVDLSNPYGTSWLSNSHDYLFGVTITGETGNALLAPAGYEHRCIRGVSLGNYAGGANIELWLILGCDFTHVLSIGVNTRAESGAIAAFNRVTDPVTSTCLTIGSAADVSNVAIVQNVFEWKSDTVGRMIGVSADLAEGSNSHIVIHNNTATGAFSAGRFNLFYDEHDTARTSKLMSVKGNIFPQINTKSDVFRGTNEAGADASSRTGNWAFEHGVGCAGNFAQFIDAAESGIGGNFAQDYPGLSCDIGTSSTVRNDPLFTDYQGTTYDGTDYHAGTGGGDYTLQAGSPAIGLLPVAVLSHTLDGTERAATNDNAGAY